MMKRLILFISLLVATLPWTSSAADVGSSLYEQESARYLGTKATVYFGPKAASFRYDKRMIHAAELAQQRAHASSKSSCWRYVKSALVDANVLSSRPTTALAKQAGDELLTKYGFKRIAVNNPYAAPVGSVLVYGGRGAGHVEIRTPFGFVSDFLSPTPSHRPLIGVYVKPS